MLHTLDASVDQLASTVRKGFKWADLRYSDELELCVCEPEHNVQGHAWVQGLWFGRFFEIPARLLQYEHEVRSRTYDGLHDSMRKAYGDDFGADEPVTVIVYVRTD
jgi:hypothetical protein